MTLFLCGDVMTGRGIDQILPHPGSPELHEAFVRDARDYVRLSERVNGDIPQPVAYSYVWGDALEELDRMRPDLRIVNLETAVTAHSDWEAKGINYRMHPDNVPCLTAAQIDCCVLANNHVLDWGASGLEETLASLHAAGIQTAGAGRERGRALAPAVLGTPEGPCVRVFAFGHGSSGILPAWAARADRPGIAVLEELSDAAAHALAERISGAREAGDIMVVSLHWGGNWGYEIPGEQIRFAHALVDAGAADIVHGHSSHHVKGIEIYRDRPILYGCGDLINDYEGIGGYELYRADLGLMYFATMNGKSGRLERLEMIPTRLRRLRLNRATRAESEWLQAALQRESAPFGVRVVLTENGRLLLNGHA